MAVDKDYEQLGSIKYGEILMLAAQEGVYFMQIDVSEMVPSINICSVHCS
jgi:hypothetical protein